MTMPDCSHADPACTGTTSKRAGRPTAARAAEINHVILATARQLFTTDGIDATSMDVVAQAAQISKGTLYARYANKDALLLAVIESLVADLDRTASTRNHLLPADLGPRLQAYCRRLVEQIAQPEYIQLNGLISAASKQHPDIARHGRHEAMASYVNTLATEMQKAAHHSKPDCVDWTGLANLLLFGITGWYQSAVSRNAFSDEAFHAYTTTVVDAIVALIETHQPADRSRRAAVKRR